MGHSCCGVARGVFRWDTGRIDRHSLHGDLDLDLDLDDAHHDLDVDLDHDDAHHDRCANRCGRGYRDGGGPAVRYC